MKFSDKKDKKDKDNKDDDDETEGGLNTNFDIFYF